MDENQILNLIDIGVLSLDLDGSISFWNRWLEKHSGRQIEEVLDHVLWELFPNIKDTGLEVQIRKVMELKQPKVFSPTLHDSVLPLLDRAVKPMEQWICIQPRLENNRVTGALITVQDASICCKTEKALQESEAKARELLDTPLDAIALMDTKGIILDVNETTARRLGRSTDELIGLCIWDLFPQNVAESRKALFDKVIETGKAIRFEDERQGMCLDNVVNPILDEEGKVTKLALLSHDITDRHLAEKILKQAHDELEQRVEERTVELLKINKRLAENEEHLRKLTEGSFEAIVLHEEGVILDANNQYYEMFGYNQEELAGKDAISLTATPESMENIRKQISLGDLGPYQVTGVKKDGTKFPMEIRIKLTDYKGHKMRMAVIRDLTELKKGEAALKKRTQELELKTKNLEEINIAMKVLLKKREADKIEIEDNVLTNVKEMIEPYFDKIKETKLDERQKTFLSIIESNMNEIISPFTRKLSLKYLRLTPTEIKIVNMIKHGYTTKKIATIMNISPRTVDTHRTNIRAKIGLENKKANLRSHLLALQL